MDAISKRAVPTSDLPLGPALDFLRRLWHLNHALEQLSSRMEKRLGVTAQQRLIVRCVDKYPGITASQLANLLHIDPGTVSAALRRIEEKGLLRRRRDPRDRRRASLVLLAKGRALERPAQGTVEDAVERLLQGAAAEQFAVARRTIEQLSMLLGEELPQAAPLRARGR